MTSDETIAWNIGYLAGVEGKPPTRRSDYSDGQWAAYLEGRTEAAARMLGYRHSLEGTEPFGDLDDGGSALLMDELGETGPTTEANHAFRVMLLSEYRNGLRAGRQVTA